MTDSVTLVPTPDSDTPALPSRRGEKALALVAVVLLLIGGGTVVQATGTGSTVAFPAPVAVPEDLVAPPAVSDAEASLAAAAAGCQLLVDGVSQEDRSHVDPRDAPPAAALYPSDRPAHSGQHFAAALSVPDRVPTEPIDERAVVHNMEHGSVVVWFDPVRVEASTVGQMQAWMRERRALGFESRAAGGIFVSPTPDIASGQAFALRAWGVALDCDRFAVVVADAFLQAHWGSRGAAPEAMLSPFPSGIMGEVGDFV